MQGKRMIKQYKQILLALTAIIYVGILVFIAFKYINANRYWEIYSYDKGVMAEGGQDIRVKARIKNKMYYVMGSDDQYFISYHVYDEAGKTIQFDNPRTYLAEIEPGRSENIDIRIIAPMEKGKYKIEIDIVKEGEYWFKDRGETPAALQLTVN